MSRKCQDAKQPQTALENRSYQLGKFLCGNIAWVRETLQVAVTNICKYFSHTINQWLVKGFASGDLGAQSIDSDKGP